MRFITALSARLTCPKPNARPIRHNGQVPDRNGKIFYTSITSLSHISKRPCLPYWHAAHLRFERKWHLPVSFPDLLVVSGLAYGIDICAHRNALKNQLPTVGVLAHGLDRIYPPVHRSTAIEMLDRGGLLTDFPSGTNPDRQNFIRRNRIVAGLADATIVIESAEKGGSLITADIAFSYGRDVYAFPGRVTDINSKGCNSLIRQNKGGLITCADDLIMAMRWDVAQKTDALPVQTQLLFPENEESERILSFLETQKESHINELSVALNLPVHQLSSLLFELELDGKIKSMPGSIYKRMKPL